MSRKYDTPEKVMARVNDLVDRVELSENDLYIRIQEGNSKLQGILNFSVVPGLTCPIKTDACTMGCYAMKPYFQGYENVARSHKANYEMTQRADFTQKMIDAIEAQLARKKYKDKHVEFRIHVSGDFYSYDYFAKWVAITDYFEGRNISFGCYTKSLSYIKVFMKKTGRTLASININFMSSIWHDTLPKMVELTEELGMNIFTAFDGKQEMPTGYIRCQDDIEDKACGRTCNLCYEKDGDKLLTDKWDAILAEAFGRKKVAIAIH